MLEVLHSQLQVISEEQVKVAVAQSVLILATQHLQTVINTLISYPLPFDRYKIFSLFSYYSGWKRFLRLDLECMWCPLVGAVRCGSLWEQTAL